MPRPPKHSPIQCKNFTWLLFRRSGVYYADGRGGKYQLGKHSLGTRDRTEALQQLGKLDAHLAIEIGLATADEIKSAPTAVSIVDGWQLYLEYSARSSVMGGVSPATLKRYRGVRDKHTKFCRQHGLDVWSGFDKRALQRYGNWLAGMHADRTVYFELTLLKSINKWLISSQLLSESAKLNMPLRKPQGTDTYCYSAQEVTTMIDHCRQTPGLAWLKPVIVGLAFTGLRISELAGLRWTDIDEGLTTMRVADERSSRRKREAGTARTTKGRRSRTIPIHPELRTLLADLPRGEDGYIFHAAQGGRVRSRNLLDQLNKHVISPLKKLFPKVTGEIGFEDGTLHSFRHFFCSQCFLGGASEGEIKEWLGHRESRMVEHYRHLRGDDAQRKMSQIVFLGQPAVSADHVS